MDETANGGGEGGGAGGRRPSGWASSAARQERRDRARAAWAHKLRCAALPAPSQAERDRLVADFLARGRAVVRCPTACVLPVQNGDGPGGRSGTPATRAAAAAEPGGASGPGDRGPEPDPARAAA
jgi:hypothetical protein